MIDQYFQLLAASGKNLKMLMAEAQLELGKMEAMFQLIQNGVQELQKKDEPKKEEVKS